MAFWTSSASTTASGVATSAGTSPSPPLTSKVRWRETTESLAIRSSDVTISSKGTWSLGSRDRISWTMAIDRTRRSASNSATRPPPGGRRRAWSRSRAEMVCRLFFTRWWTSRMAASLDSRSRSSRRTSVTSRSRTMHPVTSSVWIRGMQCSRTVTSGRRSTSSTTGSAEASAHSMADSSMPEVGEAAALDLGVHAHPVEGVGGVRRGVADPALLVDEDHAVTDPGRLLGGHLLAREREGPLGQHDGEPVEHVPVGALEVARAGGRRPADIRVSTATVSPSWRTGMQCSRTGSPPGSSSISPASDSPVSKVSTTSGQTSASTVWPTRSCSTTVELLDGRIWPEDHAARGRPGGGRPARGPSAPSAPGRRRTGRPGCPRCRAGAAGGPAAPRPGWCARRRVRRAWPPVSRPGAVGRTGVAPGGGRPAPGPRRSRAASVRGTPGATTPRRRSSSVRRSSARSATSGRVWASEAVVSGTPAVDEAPEQRAAPGTPPPPACASRPRRPRRPSPTRTAASVIRS